MISSWPSNASIVISELNVKRSRLISMRSLNLLFFIVSGREVDTRINCSMNTIPTFDEISQVRSRSDTLKNSPHRRMKHGPFECLEFCSFPLIRRTMDCRNISSQYTSFIAIPKSTWNISYTNEYRVKCTFTEPVDDRSIRVKNDCYVDSITTNLCL
jgi:hypothetical protein